MGLISRRRSIRIKTLDGENIISFKKHHSKGDLKFLKQNHVQADADYDVQYEEDEDADESTMTYMPSAVEDDDELELEMPSFLEDRAENSSLFMKVGLPFGRITFFILGFFALQFFIVLARKGFDLRKATATELDWEYLVTEKEHIKELHAYRCEKCGYTLFPARTRHKKFFEDVDNFSCPECGADKSEFVDIHDLTDPKNIHLSREELEKAMADKIKTETEALARDAGIDLYNVKDSKRMDGEKKETQAEKNFDLKQVEDSYTTDQEPADITVAALPQDVEEPKKNVDKQSSDVREDVDSNSNDFEDDLLN